MKNKDKLLKGQISKEERELFLEAYYGHKKKQEEEDFAKFLEYYPVFVKDESKAELFSQKKNQKKKRKVDAEIDLHGLLLEEAILALYDFIAKQKKKGSKILLIVHGKGAGILKNAVLGLVHTHEDVFNYKVAPFRLGGDGALMVWINQVKKR